MFDPGSIVDNLIASAIWAALAVVARRLLSRIRQEPVSAARFWAVSSLNVAIFGSLLAFGWDIAVIVFRIPRTTLTTLVWKWGVPVSLYGGIASFLVANAVMHRLIQRKSGDDR
jgi:ABC-type multidrug transport system permease subunit